MTSDSPGRAMNHVLGAGLGYFAWVFAAGFLLAPLRELWAMPTFGARVGELLEFPLMLLAIIVAAAWTNRRLGNDATAAARFAAGALALGCMLAAELAVMWWIRDLSLAAYIAGRDPVTGSVYIGLLGVFACMPWWLARRRARRAANDTSE